MKKYRYKNKTKSKSATLRNKLLNTKSLKNRIKKYNKLTKTNRQIVIAYFK
jgi:hypothetical protein